MINKKFLTLAFAFLLLCSFGVNAQSVKIAYLNTQEVLAKAPGATAAQKSLEKKRDEIMKSAQTIQKEYESKLKEFEKSKAPVTEAIANDRQKQILQLQERFTLFQRNSEKEIQQLQQKLFAPILKKVQDAIKAVGKEKGYTVIIDASALLYAGSGAINISSDVLAKLK